MTLVSNTSPLCYLTLIGHAEILPKLYGHIHITQKVLEELRHADAPPSVLIRKPGELLLYELRPAHRRVLLDSELAQ